MLSGAAANALAAEIDPRSLHADDRADGKWNAKNIRDDAVLWECQCASRSIGSNCRTVQAAELFWRSHAELFFVQNLVPIPVVDPGG